MSKIRVWFKGVGRILGHTPSDFYYPRPRPGLWALLGLGLAYRLYVPFAAFKEHGFVSTYVD